MSHHVTLKVCGVVSSNVASIWMSFPMASRKLTLGPRPVNTGLEHLHNNLFPISAFLGRPGLAAASSNVSAADVPFQRWMKIKEAFSPKFVIEAVASLPFRIERVIDPFAGSGTTSLVCSTIGIESFAIEVNPFLADLAEAKLTHIVGWKLLQAYSDVVKNVSFTSPNVRVLLQHAPPSLCEPGNRGRFVFSYSVLKRILALRLSIERLPDPHIRRLLRVLLGSILVPLSNVVINGKGRRYRSGWDRRALRPTDVDELFAEAFRRAKTDIATLSGTERSSATVLRGDCRRLLSGIPPVDAAIFSPPYPNSFDYTDVYNLELWVLGYLRDFAANRELRLSTFRSHVQIGWDQHTATPLNSPTLRRTCINLFAVRDRLWDQRIPAMVRAYFEDLSCVLTLLNTVIRPGGRAIIVLGDSCYAGVQIKSARILSEISRSVGYSVLSCDPIRSMRQSAQLGGSARLDESCIVLQRSHT
jgi:DNA modification methylase